jgi:hypothetical protein
LRWHEEGRKELNYKKDGKFRHPADATQWGNINTHFPGFNDARSLRFALRTNEGRISGVGTMGKRSVTSDADAFQKAHFIVIQQLHLITPFANEHKR